MQNEKLINGKVPLTVRHSRRARCMRLQVRSDEPEIILTVPRFAMKFEVSRFLKEKEPWIQKQWSKIEKQNALRPAPKYRTGDVFYYFGQPVHLTVRPGGKKRPVIRIRKDKMIIDMHYKISETEGRKTVKKTIGKFYRKKAEETVHDRLEHWNGHYGFFYRTVTLRNQKSRWGSCSGRKNLSFNWRLIMAPIEVIDYVIVHELCHLKEMNHSAKFWSLVAETIPEHKTLKKWLRENQYLLKI